MIYYTDDIFDGMEMLPFNGIGGGNTVCHRFEQEIVTDDEVYREFCQNALGAAAFGRLQPLFCPETMVTMAQAEENMKKIHTGLIRMGWTNQLKKNLEVWQKCCEKQAEGRGALWLRLSVITWLCQASVNEIFGETEFLAALFRTDSLSPSEKSAGVSDGGKEQDNGLEGYRLSVKDGQAFAFLWPWSGEGRLAMAQLCNEERSVITIRIGEQPIRLPGGSSLNAIVDERGAVVSVKGVISAESPDFLVYRRGRDIICRNRGQERRYFDKVLLNLKGAVSDGGGGVHYLDDRPHFAPSFSAKWPVTCKSWSGRTDIVEIYSGGGTVALLRDTGEVLSNVHAFEGEKASALVEVPGEGIYMLTTAGAVVRDSKYRKEFSASELRSLVFQRFLAGAGAVEQIECENGMIVLTEDLSLQITELFRQKGKQRDEETEAMF